MQLNFRQVGGLAYTTIADDTQGDLIDLKAPTWSRQRYAPAGYGSVGKAEIDMGNMEWVWTIPVRKFYTSGPLARQAFATLGTLLAVGNMDLQVFDISSMDATYMPNCVLETMTPDSGDGVKGTAIYFVLKFVGSSYTTVAP